MKIIRLEVESFKRVSAVTIEPDGHTVVIGGKNGSGKSSTLDAIEAAIGGKRRAPDVPIKHGKHKARIVLETEELVVTRTFSSKGTQLKVTSRDGAPQRNPQALLDSLVGPISFDPVAFIRETAAKQAQVISNVAGIDLTKMNLERQKVYETRTEEGRELRRLEAQLAALPEQESGTPDEEVSIAELMAEYDKVRTQNEENTRKQEELNRANNEADRIAAEVIKARRALEQLERDHSKAVERRDALKTPHRGATIVDLAGIRKRLEIAQDVNKAVAVKRKRAELTASVIAQQGRVQELTNDLERLADERRIIIESAKYPIEGLMVYEDQVFFNGVPIDQSSSAEQLRVSTAISLATNPELKVALIRDGSLLDDDNLRAVAEVAAQYDAQVWIERVSTGDEVSVVIEDGHVAEAERC